MKFFILNLILSFQTFALIYDKNDLQNPENFSSKHPIHQLRSSVPAMIHQDYIVTGEVESYIQSKRFNEKKYYDSNSKTEQPICAGSWPYEKEMGASFCSGVLIEKNKILTAGHCVIKSIQNRNNNTNIDCTSSEYKWVFGYENSQDSSQGIKIQSKHVYSCKNIIKFSEPWAYNRNLQDYAIIELDRDVDENIKPVAVDFDYQATKGEKVFNIGYPSALPQKINLNGILREPMNNDGNMLATIDALPGHSGSPIFSETSGKLIGIMTVAQQPFYVDLDDNKCMKLHVCPATSSCGPTEITGLQSIPELRDLELQKDSEAATLWQTSQTEPEEKKASEVSLETFNKTDKQIKTKTIERKVGKVASQIASTIHRPFSWLSGFTRGLFTKTDKLNHEAIILNEFIWNIRRSDDLFKLARSTRSREEFEAQSQKLITEELQVYIQKTLEASLKTESHELPADFLRLSTIINENELSEFIKKIETEKAMSTSEVQSKHFIKNEVVAFSAQVAAGPLAAQMIFMSAGLIYTLPTVALTAVAGVSAWQCLQEKNKQNIAWYIRVDDQLKTDLEMQKRMTTDQTLLKKFNYYQEFSKHCAQVIHVSSLKLAKSQHRGLVHGQKFQNKIERLWQKLRKGH
jgi:V8-like Glu-specific endopeptidase